MSEQEFDFGKLVGQEVVIELEAPYVYIGRLTETSTGAILLEDADVHDLRDSTSTREVYVNDARCHGVRANRKRVYLMSKGILSIALLDDVLG